MLFNSFIFVIFFILVLILYFSFSRKYRIQNYILLVASYVFYGYWDYRFLFLIFVSSIVDYFVGLKVFSETNQKKRKFFLLVSMCVNLGFLGFFKYFNFFADSLVDFLMLFGMKPDMPTLNIILPVGISFYTFQTMSYTIDIYRKKLEPIKDFPDFLLFVSFFPQLVAGPIERAVNLLPQIIQPRKITIDQVKAGLFLVVWGYYKKVVIADNVAAISDQIFNGYTNYHGLDLLIGVLAFTFQIYCDFSGYSDIARGISKLLGFELMVNFRLPYFALNPSDFWLRWHISLSSWLRDYLYIALGGNRKGSIMTYRNLSLTMLLGGLWHGASWNFVLWGAFHGLILVIYRLFDRNPEHEDPWGGQYSKIRILSKMALMFVLTMIGWVLFRAHTIDQIIYFFTQISVFTEDIYQTRSLLGNLLFFIIPLVIIQIVQYRSRNLLILTTYKPVIQGLIYGYMLIWIVVFNVRESVEFIYFQF